MGKYDYCPPYTLRAKYWRQYCPQLAMTAVHKALKEWGGHKNLITHVVSHSTTGWDVPGLSHHVLYNLELPTSARAVPVNFVGCQGGLLPCLWRHPLPNRTPMQWYWLYALRSNPLWVECIM